MPALTDAPATFGELLRRHRLALDFSQSDLAERARLSATAVSALERGVRRAPYRETVALLAEALELSERARHEFFGAADRGRSRGARNEEHRHQPAPRLPPQMTSFVGRDEEIAAIGELLRKFRCVTITGSGGIGKTRTSLEVAARFAGDSRAAVWFVDLAPLGDGSRIANKLAASFGLALSGDGDPLAALVRAIGTRRLFVLLDNCEHVVAAVAGVAAAILTACPNATVLATSRQRLGIAAESVYRLPTLPVPGPGVAVTGTTLRDFAALQLFAERAAAAEPQFDLTEARAEAVADICRRLDGIALAIELAAARLPTLGLATLRERLDERFAVLVGGSRDVPARQQTLLATIAWSYDLLDEDERAMLRRLAVFAGGWTIDAAEALCARPEASRPQVADILSSLVEKSLVSVDVDVEATRYRLLESTRAFALDKLDEFAERDRFARKHAAWMADFAGRAHERYLTMPRRPWLREVEPELDNARAALEWALRPGGDAVAGGRIASGLYGAWWTVGLRDEGRAWSAAALALIDPETCGDVAADLLRSLAGFARGKAKIEAAERAIELYGRTVDRAGLAFSYKQLSLGYAQIGRYAPAEEAVDRAASAYREIGMQRSLIFVGVLADRGAILLHRDRVAEARTVLSEAVELGGALGDDWRVAYLRNMLASLAFDAGDERMGVRLAAEAIAVARRYDSIRDEMYGLCNLACFQLVLGELEHAAAAACDALTLGRNHEPFLAHVAIQHVAAVAALRGDALRAARLLGYVDAWYMREGCVRDLTEQKGYAILTSSVREALPLATLSASIDRGAEMSEDTAFADAMDAILAARADARPTF